MNELIAADFLRATAFTGLDATADDVLAVLRRAHRSKLAATAGVFNLLRVSPDRMYAIGSRFMTHVKIQPGACQGWAAVV